MSSFSCVKDCGFSFTTEKLFNQHRQKCAYYKAFAKSNAKDMFVSVVEGQAAAEIAREKMFAQGLAELMKALLGTDKCSINKCNAALIPQLVNPDNVTVEDLKMVANFALVPGHHVCIAVPREFDKQTGNSFLHFCRIKKLPENAEDRCMELADDKLYIRRGQERFKDRLLRHITYYRLENGVCAGPGVYVGNSTVPEDKAGHLFGAYLDSSANAQDHVMTWSGPLSSVDKARDARYGLLTSQQSQPKGTHHRCCDPSVDPHLHTCGFIITEKKGYQSLLSCDHIAPLLKTAVRTASEDDVAIELHARKTLQAGTELTIPYRDNPPHPHLQKVMTNPPSKPSTLFARSAKSMQCNKDMVSTFQEDVTGMNESIALKVGLPKQDVLMLMDYDGVKQPVVTRSILRTIVQSLIEEHPGQAVHVLAKFGVNKQSFQLGDNAVLNIPEASLNKPMSDINVINLIFVELHNSDNLEKPIFVLVVFDFPNQNIWLFDERKKGESRDDTFIDIIGSMKKVLDSMFNPGVDVTFMHRPLDPMAETAVPLIVVAEEIIRRKGIRSSVPIVIGEDSSWYYDSIRCAVIRKLSDANAIVSQTQASDSDDDQEESADNGNDQADNGNDGGEVHDDAIAFADAVLNSPQDQHISSVAVAPHGGDEISIPAVNPDAGQATASAPATIASVSVDQQVSQNAMADTQETTLGTTQQDSQGDTNVPPTQLDNPVADVAEDDDTTQLMQQNKKAKIGQ
jgi:hypothetical protein